MPYSGETGQWRALHRSSPTLQGWTDGLLGGCRGDLQQCGRGLHDPHQQPVNVALQLLHMLVSLAQLTLTLQEQANELIMSQVIVLGRLVQHSRVLRPDKME